MRSTHRALPALALGTALLAAAGCGASPEPSTDVASRVPHIAEVGSRLRVFSSLNDLAAVSNALVEAVPTGRQRSVPLPEEQGGNEQSAPTVFVQMRVVRLVSGSVEGDVIEVVSPGTDTGTDEPALLSGGPYLLYLTPAMYDVDAPAGGYAVTGGPAGIYAADGDEAFARVDSLSDKLPARVNSRTTTFPRISRTEKDLIRTGGF